MNHCMVDLETMSTANNAAIVSIGAVAFTSEEVFEKFYVTISLEECAHYKMDISPSTVLWWMRQSDVARAELWAPATRTMCDALVDFSAFYRTQQCETLWGNGAAFDNVILASAYDVAGVIRPWKYNADRCFRTMKAVMPAEDHPRAGIYHNALDDAVWQAEYLIKSNHNYGMRADHSFL